MEALSMGGWLVDAFATMARSFRGLVIVGTLFRRFRDTIARSGVTVLRNSQAKMVSQRRTGIILPKNPATLQLGNHHRGKVFKRLGIVVANHIEPVCSVLHQP